MKIHYHSDHLGSASFVTNAEGAVCQHLQYLPFGEIFVSQRNCEFDSRYKFTAKELDNETSYTYFGARYYDSDLSVWLSVDPMSDKYPSTSAYMYCGGNPVILIDPNGMDEWEVNKRGEVRFVKESEEHILYEKGNRNNYITVKDESILEQLSKSGEKSNYTLSVAVGGENSQDDMVKSFKFLADNTNVEWRVDRFLEGRENKYSLGTLHREDLSPSAEGMGHTSKSTIAFIHSHWDVKPSMSEEISSMGWITNGENSILRTGDSYLKANSNLKNSIYYTYFSQSGNLWSVEGINQPKFIRNIGSNYKRFFFGTINTR